MKGKTMTKKKPARTVARTLPVQVATIRKQPDGTLTMEPRDFCKHQCMLRPECPIYNGANHFAAGFNPVLTYLLPQVESAEDEHADIDVVDLEEADSFTLAELPYVPIVDPEALANVQSLILHLRKAQELCAQTRIANPDVQNALRKATAPYEEEEEVEEVAELEEEEDLDEAFREEEEVEEQPVRVKEKARKAQEAPPERVEPTEAVIARVLKGDEHYQKLVKFADHLEHLFESKQAERMVEKAAPVREAATKPPQTRTVPVEGVKPAAPPKVTRGRGGPPLKPAQKPASNSQATATASNGSKANDGGKEGAMLEASDYYHELREGGMSFEEAVYHTYEELNPRGVSYQILADAIDAKKNEVYKAYTQHKKKLESRQNALGQDEEEGESGEVGGHATS